MSIELTMWQKKQCALLYYLSSPAYLQELVDNVDKLLKLAADTVELATRQDRDSLIRNPRWGERNTVANWKAHAWPFLLQLQSATAETVAARSEDIYGAPDFYYFARGVDEFSMDWSTPEEERAILAALHEVGLMCGTLKRLILRQNKTRALDDFELTQAWQHFAFRLPRLPKFRVRQEMTAASFERPPATGVYVVLDDHFASPQFAFAGHPAGALLHSNTLGYLGHCALRHVGRDHLWLDHEKMLAFATLPEFVGDFEYTQTTERASRAPATIREIADKAFRSRSCKWTYVEPMSDEYEDYKDIPDSGSLEPIAKLKSKFMRRIWEMSYRPGEK